MLPETTCIGLTDISTLFKTRPFDAQESEGVIEKTKRESETVDKSVNDLIDAIKEENKHTASKIDVQRVSHAIHFARDAHAGQYRKVTGEPYICHPLKVAKHLIHEGEETIIVALLHDVAEDTLKTLQDIEDEFGEEIRQKVEQITVREFKKRIPPDAPHDVREEDWIERNTRHIEGIPTMDRTVRFIDTENATDNLLSMEREYSLFKEKAFDQLTVGKELQMWRYDALIQQLKAHQEHSGEINPYLPKLEEAFDRWKTKVSAQYLPARCRTVNDNFRSWVI